MSWLLSLLSEVTQLKWQCEDSSLTKDGTGPDQSREITRNKEISCAQLDSETYPAGNRSWKLESQTLLYLFLNNERYPKNE